MVFEKRLEALRETYEVLSKYLTVAIDLHRYAAMYQIEAVIQKIGPDDMSEKTNELSIK